MVVNKTWANENKDFMVSFVKTIAEADEAYRSDPSAFGADSENAKKIVGLVGGEAGDVAGRARPLQLPDA